MIKKEIPNLKGYYIDIYSNIYGKKVLKQQQRGNYIYVFIRGNFLRVDKLMACTFFKNCSYHDVNVIHISSNKLDNKLYNLDIVKQYFSRVVGLKSKYKGLSYCKRNKKWKAFYKDNYLGLFTEEYDGFIAYEAAKAKDITA